MMHTSKGLFFYMIICSHLGHTARHPGTSSLVLDQRPPQPTFESEEVQMGVVDMIQLEGGPADTLYQSLQGTSLGVWMLWVYYILFYSKPFNTDPGRRQTSSEVFYVMGSDMESYTTRMNSENDNDELYRWSYWSDMTFQQFGEGVEQMRKEEDEAARTRSYHVGWKASFILDMTTHQQRLMQALHEEDPYNFELKRLEKQPILTAVASTNLLGQHFNEMEKRYLALYDTVVTSTSEPWRQLNSHSEAMSEFLRYLTGQPFSLSASLVSLKSQHPEVAHLFDPPQLIPILIKGRLAETGNVTKDTITSSVLNAGVDMASTAFLAKLFSMTATHLTAEGLCGVSDACFDKADEPECQFFRLDKEATMKDSAFKQEFVDQLEIDTSVEPARLLKAVTVSRDDDGDICLSWVSIRKAYTMVIGLGKTVSTGKLQVMAKALTKKRLLSMPGTDEETRALMKTGLDGLKGGRLLPLEVNDYHVYARPRPNWNEEQMDKWSEVQMLFWDALGGDIKPMSHTDRLQEVMVAKLISARQPPPLGPTWRNFASWDKILTGLKPHFETAGSSDDPDGASSAADELKGGLRKDLSVKSDQGLSAPCFADRISTPSGFEQITDGSGKASMFKTGCLHLTEAAKMMFNRQCRIRTTTGDLTSAVGELGMTRKQFNWYAGGPVVYPNKKHREVQRHVTLAELLEDKKFRMDQQDGLDYIRAIAMGPTEMMDALSIIVRGMDFCDWIKDEEAVAIEDKLQKFVLGKPGLLSKWSSFEKDAESAYEIVASLRKRGMDKPFLCGSALAAEQKVHVYQPLQKCWVPGLVKEVKAVAGSSTKTVTVTLQRVHLQEVPVNREGELLQAMLENMLTNEPEIELPSTSVRLRRRETPDSKYESSTEGLKEHYKHGAIIKAEFFFETDNGNDGVWCASEVKLEYGDQFKYRYSADQESSAPDFLDWSGDSRLIVNKIRARPDAKNGAHQCTKVED